jgi:hypothetical protein
MKIRITPESSVVVAQPTITLGQASGTIQLDLNDSETTAINMKGATYGSITEGTDTAYGLIGVYDLKVTIGTVSKIILSGNICLVQEISR